MIVSEDVRKMNPELSDKRIKGARVKKKNERARTYWEDLLFDKILEAGLPPPTREFQFAGVIGRKWRADFAWIGERILVEVEGAVWAQGRHTRGKGYIQDCKKYNFAQLLGYKVYRFTPDTIENGEAVEMIQNAFEYGVK